MDVGKKMEKPDYNHVPVQTTHWNWKVMATKLHCGFQGAIWLFHANRKCAYCPQYITFCRNSKNVSMISYSRFIVLTLT